MSYSRILAATLLLSTFALSGCAVGPNYEVPTDALAKTPAANAAFTDANTASLKPDAPPDSWWRLYRDPRLDKLIAEAFEANTDLRVAEANLERSRAQVEGTDAARQPSLSAKVGISREQVSGESYLLKDFVPPENLYDSGLTVAYDLDLFGQLKRTIEAAKADDEAIEAARDLVRVNVAADTTRAYVELCNAGAELAVARHALDLQRQSLALTRQMVAAGRAASLDAVRSTGLANQLAANLPTLEARQRNALLRLTALTGHTPSQADRALEFCTKPPRLYAVLPIGNGAELLRRRPDIRVAERHLAAATASIGVAVAGLYPDITLRGSIGSIGALSDLGKPDTNTFGFGPALSWQLNQSATRARIAASEADTKAALARFDGAVIGALRETESALNVYLHDLQRERDLRAARDQADLAVKDAHEMQVAGRGDALVVIDAERTEAATNLALASQQSQVAIDQVNLFLALGGGWGTPLSKATDGLASNAVSQGERRKLMRNEY